jgi:hypothetical protein
VSRIKTLIRRSVQPIHHRFRSGKSEQFLSLLSTHNPGRLLDVGGGTGTNGEFITKDLQRDRREPRSAAQSGRNGTVPGSRHQSRWPLSPLCRWIVRMGFFQRRYRTRWRLGDQCQRRGNKAGRIERIFHYHAEPLLSYRAACLEPISMLTKKKLQMLFPEARVQCVNFASALTAFYVV